MSSTARCFCLLSNAHEALSPPAMFVRVSVFVSLWNRESVVASASAHEQRQRGSTLEQHSSKLLHSPISLFQSRIQQPFAALWRVFSVVSRQDTITLSHVCEHCQCFRLLSYSSYGEPYEWRKANKVLSCQLSVTWNRQYYVGPMIRLREDATKACMQSATKRLHN